MNTTDKYSKDHLNDSKNRTPLEHYRGYFIDKVYRKICYKNKNKVWMYVRSVDSKPGYVYLFSHGQLVTVNERAIAHAILGPYVPKPVPNANVEIARVLDKSFKPSASIMSKQTFIPKKENKRGRPPKKDKIYSIADNANRLKNLFDEN